MNPGYTDTLTAQSPASGRPGPSTAGPAKRAAVALAFLGTRWMMRLPLPRAAKMEIEKFIWRYLSFQPNEIWARTKFGARVFCCLQDEIQRRLIYFGTWEPNLTAFVESRLQPGDCFVDVGSNIGYFSLLASKRVGPQGLVVAIEASPKTFARLRKHIDANRCANVRAINVAVAGQSGVLQLFSGPPENCGRTSTLASRGLQFESEVRADRLDAVLLPRELASARLIKIDVEGAEAPILATLLDNPGRYNPALEIVVEVNPAEVAESGTTVERILAGFADAGFHAYLLDNDYSSAAYVARQAPTRPTRLRQAPSTVADIVFSRVDAEQL